MSSKVEYLVVDTSAFIKNTQLQEIGTNIVTLEDVVDEIKSKRQLRRLVVLPYDLSIKDVFPENVKFVTEFAKKTGDYPSLSATDIKVMALTYQLEKEHVGTGHLKTIPECPKSVEYTDHSMLNPTDIAGFYLPKTDKKEMHFDNFEQEDDEEFIDDDSPEESRPNIEGGQGELDVREVTEEDEGRGDEEDMREECSMEELARAVEGVSMEEVVERVEESGESGISEGEGSEEGWDDGWITPANLAQAKRDMNKGLLEEKPAKVACLTTDFAMQNVLKQMGLTVVSLDGMVIGQVRTYILRCYACFKTTSIMTKLFCPNCGNKTLKRVGVTVDADGKQHIHINLRRPLTGRGKRFSLPKPQGGKHAVNPVLCEDQRIPDQKVTKLARAKTDPMDPDYIAGFSPFVMRDVNSKSVMLGVHRKGDFKYWMRKNPNQVVKNRKKK